MPPGGNDFVIRVNADLSGILDELDKAAKKAEKIERALAAAKNTKIAAGDPTTTTAGKQKIGKAGGGVVSISGPVSISSDSISSITKSMDATTSAVNDNKKVLDQILLTLRAEDSPAKEQVRRSKEKSTEKQTRKVPPTNVAGNMAVASALNSAGVTTAVAPTVGYKLPDQGRAQSHFRHTMTVAGRATANTNAALANLDIDALIEQQYQDKMRRGTFPQAGKIVTVDEMTRRANESAKRVGYQPTNMAGRMRFGEITDFDMNDAGALSSGTRQIRLQDLETLNRRGMRGMRNDVSMMRQMEASNQAPAGSTELAEQSRRKMIQAAWDARRMERSLQKSGAVASPGGLEAAAKAGIVSPGFRDTKSMRAFAEAMRSMPQLQTDTGGRSRFIGIRQLAEAAREDPVAQAALNRTKRPGQGEAAVAGLMAGESKKTVAAKKATDGYTASLIKKTEADKAAKAAAISTNKAIAQGNNVMGTAIRRAGLWMVASAAVMTVVRAGAAFIGVMVKMDKQMADLRKTLSGSEKDFTKLTDSAINIARRYKANTQDVLDAMELFSKKFKRTADLESLAESAILFANISGQTLTQSAETLTSVIQQYDLAVSQASDVTDKWAAVAAQTAVSVKDLGDAVGGVGVAAKTVGLDLGQLNAIVGAVVGGTGQTGKQVSTGLRRIFERTTAPRNTQKLQEMGIQPFMQTGVDEKDDPVYELRPFMDILDNVNDKWKDFSDTKKKDIAVAFAGARQYNSFLAIMNNYSEITRLVTVQQNSLGEAQRQNDRIAETFTKKVDRLGVEFDALARNFSIVLTILGKMVDVMSDTMHWFNNLNKEGDELTKTIGRIVQGVITLTGAMTAMNLVGKLAVSQGFFAAMGKNPDNKDIRRMLPTGGVGKAAIGAGLVRASSDGVIGFSMGNAITRAGRNSKAAAIRAGRAGGGVGSIARTIGTTLTGLGGGGSVFKGLFGWVSKTAKSFGPFLRGLGVITSRLTLFSAAAYGLYKIWDTLRYKGDESIEEQSELRRTAQQKAGESGKIAKGLDKIISEAEKTGKIDKERASGLIRDLQKDKGDEDSSFISMNEVVARQGLVFDRFGSVVNLTTDSLKELSEAVKRSSDLTLRDADIKADIIRSASNKDFGGLIPEGVGFGQVDSSVGPKGERILRPGKLRTLGDTMLEVRSRMLQTDNMPLVGDYTDKAYGEFKTGSRGLIQGFQEDGGTFGGLQGGEKAFEAAFKAVRHAEQQKRENTDLKIPLILADTQKAMDAFDKKNPNADKLTRNMAEEKFKRKFLLDEQMELHTEAMGDAPKKFSRMTFEQFVKLFGPEFKDIGGQPITDGDNVPKDSRGSRGKVIATGIDRVDFELQSGLVATMRDFESMGGHNVKIIQNAIGLYKRAISDLNNSISKAAGPDDEAAKLQTRIDIETEIARIKDTAAKRGKGKSELTDAENAQLQVLKKQNQTIKERSKEEKELLAIAEKNLRNLEATAILQESMRAPIASALQSVFTQPAQRLNQVNQLEADKDFVRQKIQREKEQQKVGGFDNTAKGRNNLKHLREEMEGLDRQIESVNKNTDILNTMFSSIGSNISTKLFSNLTDNIIESMGTAFAGDELGFIFKESNPQTMATNSNTTALRTLTLELMKARGASGTDSEILGSITDSGKNIDRTGDGIIGVGDILGGNEVQGPLQEADQKSLDSYISGKKFKAAIGGAIAGAGVGSQMTSSQNKTGMGGAIGGAIGGAAGTYMGGAFGAMAGSALGGVIGSMFDKPIEPLVKELDELETEMSLLSQTIEKNTKTLNDVMETIINAPSNFILPIPKGILENSITAQSAIATPLQAGGLIVKSGPAYLHAGETVSNRDRVTDMNNSGGGGGMKVDININGSDSSPKEIATQVMGELNRAYKNQGLQGGNRFSRF